MSLVVITSPDKGLGVMLWMKRAEVCVFDIFDLNVLSYFTIDF